jgi:hypothetical protein
VPCSEVEALRLARLLLHRRAQDIAAQAGVPGPVFCHFELGRKRLPRERRQAIVHAIFRELLERP